jgi:hypothetical protein
MMAGFSGRGEVCCPHCNEAEWPSGVLLYQILSKGTEERSGAGVTPAPGRGQPEVEGRGLFTEQTLKGQGRVEFRL